MHCYFPGNVVLVLQDLDLMTTLCLTQDYGKFVSVDKPTLPSGQCDTASPGGPAVHSRVAKISSIVHMYQQTRE